MPDELRKDQDTEVEGHAAHPPEDGASVEPTEDGENDFEAHVLHFPTVRMD